MYSLVKKFLTNDSEYQDEATTSNNFQQSNTEEKIDTKVKCQTKQPLIKIFKTAVKKTYTEFCKESTIPGFHYLYASHKHREKIFWIALLIAASIQSIYLLHKQYKRWQSTPVIVSLSERGIPVSQIPFPAVTICTEHKYIKTEAINFTRFFNYIDDFAGQPSLIRPPLWLNDDEYLKMRALLQVCGNFLAKGIKFAEYPPISMTDHLNQIVPSFENYFKFCMFHQIRHSECAPLFEKIYTEEGICYTFNALNQTELYREDTYQYQYFKVDRHVHQRKKAVDWTIDKGYSSVGEFDTYPERVIGKGLAAGLVVGIQGHKKDVDLYCRGPVHGFKVILHSPDNVPQAKKSFFIVPYEQDVLILVKPFLTYTTDDVRHYTPEQRHCYYPNERYLRFFQFYTKNNCEIECLANFTLHQCGCVHFSMPRLSDTKVCDAAHIDCYDHADDAFQFSEFTDHGNLDERCNCLPGCWEIDYNVEISHGTFNMAKLVEVHPSESFAKKYRGADISRVTIYFKAHHFFGRKRSEFFGTGEFLAQCGGLLGLVLGLTAVNFFELLYFWTVQLFKNNKNLREG